MLRAGVAHLLVDLTFVGGTVTLVGGTVTLVGGTVTLVGGTVTVVGGTVTLISLGRAAASHHRTPFHSYYDRTARQLGEEVRRLAVDFYAFCPQPLSRSVCSTPRGAPAFSLRLRACDQVVQVRRIGFM
jgi:hypothetical protein